MITRFDSITSADIVSTDNLQFPNGISSSRATSLINRLVSGGSSTLLRPIPSEPSIDQTVSGDRKSGSEFADDECSLLEHSITEPNLNQPQEGKPEDTMMSRTETPTQGDKPYRRTISFEKSSSQQQQQPPASSMNLLSRTITVPKTNDGYINPAYSCDPDDGDDDFDYGEQDVPLQENNVDLRPDGNSATNKQDNNYVKLRQSLLYNQTNNGNKAAEAGAMWDVTLDDNNDQNPDNQQNTEDQEEREWDRFMTLPPPDDDETLNSDWVEISIKWFKVFAYFFTFAVVLAFAVLSKSLTLLMSSMVQPDRTVTVCNTDTNYIIHRPLDHDKQYTVVYEATGLERQNWIWCLYLATVAPYVFTFVRSARMCYFKTCIVSRFQTFLTVLCLESLHCVGLSLLLFVVLPTIDATKGAMMMNSVCTIPSLLRLFVSRNKHSEASISELSESPVQNSPLLTWFNFLLQIVQLIAWTAVGYHEESKVFYLIPVALVLVSIEWWENYLTPDAMSGWLDVLESARKDLRKSRYFTYCFISVWKIFLLGCLVLLHEFIVNKESQVVQQMFTNFTDGFSNRTIPVVRYKSDYEFHKTLENDRHSLYVEDKLVPIWILILHIASTYVCYAFAKFTCKVCIQGVSFAIPVSIAVPTTVSVLWAISNVAIQNKCRLTEMFAPFQYIFWYTNKTDTFTFDGDNLWLSTAISVIWLLAMINQICNSLHIWHETTERLASTEQLFINPMFNSVLIDQSLVFNRRRVKVSYNADTEDAETNTGNGQKDIESKPEAVQQNNSRKQSEVGRLTKDDEIGLLNIRYKEAELQEWEDEEYRRDWFRLCDELGIDEDSIDAKPDPEEDETVRIYVCATMWHEDRNEMLQMLKAVIRLDFDQGVRRIARENFMDENQSQNYYELEVNIFFDDAFEQGDTEEEDDRKVNKFVIQLVETMNDAANQVLGKIIVVENPTIVPTPYGGKLIWKLPGGNRLIAHVKDKDLIRHRKRWSQCMYMYYLLGYRLAARPDIDERRKKKIANNMFVLALDGDINFQPQAVHLVVDLMKKNHKLGAACGRIHPIGSGPIVWYQKFEYAIGHWTQKATEHVFGCVLCSPGCFSLFRARALMDKSVMNKYTTKPTEARHYIQYDQGEDRWLCTLLLQRGWRIEYCAASDSYTHAPEGFAEFYTQRRRWAPSTMANIMDLLGDYKKTIENNENISYLYIAYQAFLMIGTVISPGTIFLMVVSAMNTAMGFDSQTSLLCNLIPILAFVVACLKFKKNDNIILFATMLSVVYSLLMLAVLVGTGIDMSQQGFLAPNSLFFSAMMASFVISAIIHPQEFSCIIPLLLYMLFIPSMYLLLTIYSVTNMHIVAWGTREVKSKLSAKEMAKQKEEEEADAKEAAAASKKGSIFSNMLDVGQYGSGKYGMLSCMCCSSTPSDSDSIAIKEIHSHVTEMKSTVSALQSRLPVTTTPNNSSNMHRTSGDFSRQNSLQNSITNLISSQLDQIVENSAEDASSSSRSSTTESEADTVHGTTQQQPLPSPPQPQPQPSVDQKAKIPLGIPKWIYRDDKLRNFPRKQVHPRELTFWREMIDKYLLPLDEDRKEKARIVTELQELRNKAVFAFGFINVIFVLFVFMLQLHKDVFGIDIPVGVTYNRTMIEDEDRYEIESVYTYTRMDPIGLMLVICFGMVLIVQIIGMFIHRFGTLAHLLAYTHIDFFKKDPHSEAEKMFDSAKYVKELIQYENRASSDDDSSHDGEPSNEVIHGVLSVGHPGNTSRQRDGTVRISKRTQPTTFTMDGVFQKQMDKLETDHSHIQKLPSLVRKNTVHALSRRDKSRPRKTSLYSESGDTIQANSPMALSLRPGSRPNSAIVQPSNSFSNSRPVHHSAQNYMTAPRDYGSQSRRRSSNLVHSASAGTARPRGHTMQAFQNQQSTIETSRL